MMFNFKYDGRMGERPGWLMTAPDIADVAFDLERLNPQTIGERIKAAVLSFATPYLLWFAREFCPFLRIGGLQFITRHKDVKWALENQADFRVHFNPEVREFAGGASTFMLALDGELHKCQRTRIENWFTAEVNTRYANLTTEVASKLLKASGGRIDVMKDYFTRTSAEVGIALLGLDVDDPDAFADWTIAMSNANFADFQGDPIARELASYGAWRERGVVDRAIAHARNRDGNARGLLAYLLRPDVLGADSDTIRSVIFGVSVALAPTITIGAGNMLAYLKSNPDALAECIAAAQAGDRPRLQKLLLEVGRLQPALFPGQFRYAPHDVAVPGGLFGPRRIKGGSTVIVCTASALRDRRVFAQPGRFLPDRDTSAGNAWMMFGSGAHYCLGAELAIQQLTRLFEELLRQPDLDFATGKDGMLARVGPFPRQQFVQFSIEGQPRGQAEIICHMPVGNDPAIDIELLRAEVRALANPAQPDVAESLKKTGIIHFVSMTLIDDPVPEGRTHSLVLELRADGDDRHALVRLVSAMGTALQPLLARAGFDGNEEGLVDFLLDSRLRVKTWPWGATGLHYNGSREFSAFSKDRQAELAAFARKAVDFYMRWTSGHSTRPITAIQFVRSLINGSFDEFCRRGAFRPIGSAEELVLKDLQGNGPGFVDMLTIPSRQRLAFVDWRDKSDWDKVSGYLASPAARPALIAGLLAVVVAAGLVASAIALPFLNVIVVLLAAALITAAAFQLVKTAPALITAGGLIATSLVLWFGNGVVGGILLAVVTAVGLLLLTATIAAFLFFRQLRRLEITDRPDERDPDRANLRAIAALENAPGYQQNHITAISDTKTGLFRRLTLSLAMWGISVLVAYWFRPGFIATMGTIHFATWVRLPKSGKLLFVSNYDGSWDSYLEDFITKVPSGQTAAWTHAIGFPRTRNLIDEGVRDADRFKRWVRRQQRPTDFWYSRRPDLTLDRVRTNALVHDGLARAASDTAARQWLGNFGSAQGTDTLLETSEIQTVVFRGLAALAHGAVMLVELPASAQNRQTLIEKLLAASDDMADFPRIAFGEMPAGGTWVDSVAYLAFSAGGLQYCGIPLADMGGDPRQDGLASFPFAFTEGMRRRARIIGDPEARGADDWDDEDFGGGKVHAALHVLAKTADLRDRNVAAFKRDLESLGGRLLDSIATDPADPAWPQRDHFQFRDGISQPVIRGSFGEKRALERDRMQAGEFVFGYRGNQGFVAPGLRVTIESDRFDYLPDVTTQPSSRFPAARKLQEARTLFRDFGRNGSFFVIRRLEQHVDRFSRFTQDTVKVLEVQFPSLAATIGAPIDERWVAAKMIGRWQDGVPLTARIGPDWRQAQRPPVPTAAKPFIEANLSSQSNDFSFAKDDPRGLACPLGAHVRRANPRDGLIPDDPEGLGVTNRHRILRRGRSYVKTRQQGTEKGLLFMALCSDIERQFEFLQQRWINGPSFHGLENETDPIIGQGDTAGVFTVPTVAGPVRLPTVQRFVTARGGGYFFLPSRSALRYLATLQSERSPAASSLQTK